MRSTSERFRSVPNDLQSAVLHRIRLAVPAAVVALTLLGSVIAQAQAPNRPASDGWGEPAGGLRARVVAVKPDADEQKPVLPAAPAASYTRAEELTLVVELKNVSDKPVSLQGTRYGDSVSPPWPGKSVSESFAPYLFECEFLDAQGKVIDRPGRTMASTDAMLTLSGGLAETVAPGKSLLMLIRPVLWDDSLVRLLSTGEFRVRVHYKGPAPDVLKQMQKHWPDKPLAGVWTGDVSATSGPVKIVADPSEKLPDLAWGEAVNGLQAAVEFRSESKSRQGRRDSATGIFPYGARLGVRLHVKNVGKEDISFWSETWRQDDQVSLINDDGKATVLQHSWYSGWPRIERWTLKPGQIALLSGISLGLAADEEAAKSLTHPVSPVIVRETGPYHLRYALKFGPNGRKDKDGKDAASNAGIWQGTLTTGAAPITIRERNREDDPPTITGRLQFRTPDGKPVEKGEVQVYVQAGWKSLLKAELESGELAVPDCPLEPLIVSVQAPGFEETRIYDVTAKPDAVTALTLTPSQPLKFRLVTDDGQPVAGAEVRYFNRSKAGASAGPYPTSGLKGPVWAKSDANGAVVLDFLQKFDPADKSLGNNIYHFYIVPKELAPLFIGPVEAGQDLGTIAVGSYLEVTGEIRGTAEELAAFSAEWDQPEPMKRGNGEVGWHYAESKELTVRRDGDRLTFALDHLRPGKLRIVSRFKRGGKPISHVYTRREPNEDDVVFEIDLTETRDDLVVTNKADKPAK